MVVNDIVRLKNGVVSTRALAEAAATVRGAENFTLKSKGKKKLKKAKFKTLAEGSLMTGTEDISIREEFQVDRSSDPSYRDQHSDMMLLPHRSLSQRKRKAPMLLKEEVRVEAHTKKLKKNHFGKDRRVAGEKVLYEIPDTRIWLLTAEN